MHPMAIIAGIMAMAIARAGAGPQLPPVREVERVAISCARIDVAEAAGWRRKARQAAFVPRVQIDYGHRFRNDIDININDNVYVGASGVVVGPEEGKYNSGSTVDHNLGFRAVWDLGESVFSSKQLAASAEARRVVATRNEIIAQVAKSYYAVEGFGEEAALLALLKGRAKDPAVVEHKIFLRSVACREAAAALDGMTEGWFGRAAGGALCEAPEERGRGG
ncbi:MAG: hypothetical protein JXA24_00025 [Proteobacteria bacterium]|nr:hypothetical protein [Pseudomonadota bacterium]